eukprot:scaffold25609_cov16-Tisochrysis_lutea.AAC.2
MASARRTTATCELWMLEGACSSWRVITHGILVNARSHRDQGQLLALHAAYRLKPADESQHTNPVHVYT